MAESYKYMVSTRCWTYNHASYIRDAMNGFCMQETAFQSIYCIVDDFSTDGEQEIIKEYLEENFLTDKESILERGENADYQMIMVRHKTNENCIFAVFFLKYNHYKIRKPKYPYLAPLENASKYNAICEGDDYWIAPNKIQRQIDYLENHSECGMVHAKAKVFNQEKNSYTGICGEQNGNFESTLLKNPIVTLTVCCRSCLTNEYITERALWNVSGWRMGDYPAWIWFAHRSRIEFMDEVVAVYREVDGSLTHGSLENRLNFIKSTEEIRLFFANLYKVPASLVKKVKYSSLINSANACLKYGDKERAKQYLGKLTLKDRIRIWLRH